MTSEELKEKTAKLPVWARDRIRYLEIQAEPFTAEIVRLRRENESIKSMNRRLKDRVDAMVEMFSCAAKGESEIAKAVMKIIDDYITSSEE